MRSTKVIGVLFLAACAADPGSIATLEEAAVVGPSGTAMWNRHIQPPAGSVFHVSSVAATPDGEAVMGGWGSGTLSLGGPSLTLGQNDVALARYDVNGRLLWQLAGTYPGDDTLLDVVVGPDGSIAAWGRGRPNLGCGPLDVSGTAVFWIARVSADGSCIFSRSIGASQSNPFLGGGGVAIDPTTGDLLVVTAVAGALAVQGETGTVWQGPTTSSTPDLVVLRFAPDGDLLDVAGLGGGEAQPRAIDVDGAGRVLVAGTIYDGGGDAGGGVVTPTRSAAFVTSASAGLEVTWSHAWGDDAAMVDMDVMADGHIALAGSFRGDLDFGDTTTTTPFVSRDIFVVKLDAAGDDLWNRHIWGDADFNVGRVAFDAAGFVYATGNAVNGVVRIGSFRDVLDGWKIWMTRLGAASGSVVWATTYGDGSFLFPNGLAPVPNARRFYLAGNFEGVLDLGDDRGAMSTSSRGQFVARMVR